MPTCLEIVIYVHIICWKNILNQLQHWNHEHQHHRQSHMSQESLKLQTEIYVWCDCDAHRWTAAFDLFMALEKPLI